MRMLFWASVTMGILVAAAGCRGGGQDCEEGQGGVGSHADIGGLEPLDQEGPAAEQGDVEEVCATVTAGDFVYLSPPFPAYVAPLSQDLGEPDEEDVVIVLINPTSEHETVSGIIDLSSDGNDNLDTCWACVIVVQDITSDEDAKLFMAVSGTLDLGTAVFTMDDNEDILITDGSLGDVSLVEVTLDQEAFSTTPVPGGACLGIPSAAIVQQAPEE